VVRTAPGERERPLRLEQFSLPCKTRSAQASIASNVEARMKSGPPAAFIGW
jgi:hypothetical protein